MEVKINREIRDYTESMFFGLSLRQFLFSIIASIVALCIFLIFKRRFGTETLSWLCTLGAAPFVALGFVKYQGMSAEKFLLAGIKFEVLVPKQLPLKQRNFYYEILKEKKERG